MKGFVFLAAALFLAIILSLMIGDVWITPQNCGRA